jgi:hypothetical protein
MHSVGKITANVFGLCVRFNGAKPVLQVVGISTTKLN